MTEIPKDRNSDELLLLATEQQVHAFALKETFRISLGRHDSNDVQLGSRTVSNYHAEIIKEPIVWENGYIIPPDAPGLGVELDEKVAAKHPYIPWDKNSGQWKRWRAPKRV